MKLVVYGSRTFGRVVRHLVEDCGHEFGGFIDDMHTGADVLGPLEAVVRTHPPAAVGCVNAVGYKDLGARLAVTSRIAAAGYNMPPLVHERAHVGRGSTLGAGCIVMAGALIDVNVEIGSCVVVWPGAVVSHDSSIGANTFLSPNSTVCGNCRIGSSCFIGAGAVVVDHASMADGTRVKALERYMTRT